MRVLNPGPGEVEDRLTVVARKIIEGGGEVFERELDELLSWWAEGNYTEIEGAIAKPCFLLAAVNAAIWQREDELRVIRKYMQGAAPEATVQLAFRIQELNDKRAELVREINKAAGVDRREKL